MAGPQIGYGTTFTWDGDPVGELTRIGPVNITIAKQDSTNLGATNEFKTVLPGLLDPGDVEIEGWFTPSDTGQAGMLADMLSRTVKAFIITFPTSISTSTWTGNAYVTAFSAGDATPEGIVPWSATISITGKPTLGVTAGDDLTGLVFTGDISGVIALTPVFAGATYVYTWNGTAENTFTVTPTCAAATTIEVNGSIVASGVASSSIDTLPNDLVDVTVITKTTGKSWKTYTITVFDGL